MLGAHGGVEANGRGPDSKQQLGKAKVSSCPDKPVGEPSEGAKLSPGSVQALGREQDGLASGPTLQGRGPPDSCPQGARCSVGEADN